MISRRWRVGPVPVGSEEHETQQTVWPCTNGIAPWEWCASATPGDMALRDFMASQGETNTWHSDVRVVVLRRGLSPDRCAGARGIRTGRRTSVRCRWRHARAVGRLQGDATRGRSHRAIPDRASRSASPAILARHHQAALATDLRRAQLVRPRTSASMSAGGSDREQTSRC